MRIIQGLDETCISSKLHVGDTCDVHAREGMDSMQLEH